MTCGGGGPTARTDLYALLHRALGRSQILVSTGDLETIPADTEGQLSFVGVKCCIWTVQGDRGLAPLTPALFHGRLYFCFGDPSIGLYPQFILFIAQ